MKKNILTITLALVVLSFAACKSNTEEVAQKTEIKNAALAALLKTKGYTLEGNMLVLDEKVKNTTSLDLSGTKLTDVSGLDVFPNLEEVNLADNGLGPAFDFAPLPKTIKSVNLSGNTIYEYQNLATTDYDKGEYTLIRPLDKLILPAAAKYNMDALPAFLKTAPQCDMQMHNTEGKTEKYTTLREVPDAIMRAFLKETFPGKFEGDKLDIAKRFKLEETLAQVQILRGGGGYNDPRFEELKSLEGFEYIINDHGFAGAIMLYFNKEEEKSLAYLKPGKSLQTLFMIYVSTPILDMTNAEALYQFASYHNKSLSSIDLSASKKILQRGEKGHDGFSGDIIALVNCPLLTEVKLPDLSKTPSPISALGFDLIELPLLKFLDVSKVEVLNRLFLGGLPQCNIKYPANILYFTNNGTKDENGKLSLSVAKDIFSKTETSAFINKYKKEKKLATSEGDFGMFPDIKLVPYDYLKSNNQSRSSKNHKETNVPSLIDIFSKTT